MRHQIACTLMTNDTYKHQGAKFEDFGLARTSDWTINSIFSLWLLRALPILMIAFGSEPIKGAENIND